MSLPAVVRHPLPLAGTTSPDRVCVFPGVVEASDALGPLLDAQASPDLFQTTAWFANLERHGLPAGATPLALALHRDDAGSALCLPLMVQPRGDAALYGPVLESMTTYYSSLYGPIGRPGSFAPAALAQALHTLGRRAEVLRLQPLDIDAAFQEELAAGLREAGYLVDHYFCFGNWHLPCAGLSFDRFHAGLPSKVRNTIQRHRKKLDRNGPWNIEISTQPGAAMDAAIDAFVKVYNRSWKVPEPFPEFVPGLCRAAASEGWLRLGVLRIGGVPAAAQLWLVRERKAMIYKLAYDESFSQFSPGSVLSAEMFRCALDDEGVVDIDYLTGDDAYKRDWMSQRRERHGIIAFRRASVRGLLSAARHHAGRHWRRWRAADRATALPEGQT